MDPRHALMLQIEWGADEALEPAPGSRLRPPAPASPPRTQPRPARPPLPTSSALPPRLTNLDEFAAALAAFDGAGLATTATNLVLPAGVPGGLMVVGEAPGAAEDRSGDAFVGPEGQLLRRMLASIGIDPARIMLAYLAPWRPPGGRAPGESEVAACLPWLRQLLGLARPSVLLLLGGVSAKGLLGPGARRGRWAELAIDEVEKAIPVLATVNPAVLLKQPRQKAAAWADLRALRRRIDGQADQITNS